MLRAMVLEALARAANEGLSGVQAEARVRGEPLLRPAARRQVARAFSVAHARSSSTDEAHIARTAYLAAAEVACADDPAAVRAAFAAARPPRAGMWWLSAGLVALAAAAALTLPARLAPREPAAAGLYATGGAAPPSPLGPRLGDALGDFSEALNRRSEAGRVGLAEVARTDDDLTRARARVLDLAAPLGPGGVAGFTAALDAARHAAMPPFDGVESSRADFAAAVRAADDGLVGAGVPFVFDGELIVLPSGKRIALLSLFAVERVSRFRAGDARLRVLHGRLHDRIDVHGPDLGVTRPALRETLVNLDAVERLAIEAVLPALGESGELRLPGGDFADRKAVEARAGAVARRELAGLPVDAAALGRTAAALARRRDLVVALAPALQETGPSVPRMTSLHLAPGARAALETVLPAPALRELDAIEAELGGDGPAACLAAVGAALAASVEARELARRLDLAAPPPDLPPRLAALGGDRRAQAELSAILAGLQRDERTPGFSLTLAARALFDDELWGRPESLAAVVAFEGLAAELGVAPAPLVASGLVDRAAAARLYLALTDRPAAELRAAAGRLWEKLFGARLVAVERL